MKQVQGWNSTNPTFKDVIEEICPRTIIEVGSWKGASAIHMASLCEARLYCVDTWLGSFEHHRDGWIPFGHYPTLFQQFIENTAHLRGRITPLPMPSNIAAKVLAHHHIMADLIYIDASHDYEDVGRDLRDYWNLINAGGMMFGDDYSEWADVKKAVDEFGRDVVHAPPRIHHGKFWSFKR